LVNKNGRRKMKNNNEGYHRKPGGRTKSKNQKKNSKRVLSPAEETVLAEFDMDQIEEDFKHAAPSIFTCPECKGVLWELKEGAMRRFRCKVGHAYTAQAMASEQQDKVDEALWVALTTLEETAALARKMADDAHQKQQTWTAK